MERKMSENNCGFKMEWNQSGIEMEMEMEWIFTIKKVDDGMEMGMVMEWKWNGNFATKEIDAKWNGNGMEMEWK